LPYTSREHIQEACEKQKGAKKDMSGVVRWLRRKVQGVYADDGKSEDDGVGSEASDEDEQEAARAAKERAELDRQVKAMMAREAWAERRAERFDKKNKIIPLTLVAGPLGAGKTTLTRRIVESVRDFTLGVIVNDFASLNIDSKRLEEDIAIREKDPNETKRAVGSSFVPKVVELSGGCICCSLSDGLASAVRAMVEKAGSSVDYVVVETSGLTNPIEMVRVIEQELGSNVRLDSVVYLLDADNWEEALNGSDGRDRQLAHADVVVLNKVDLLDAESNELEEHVLPAIAKKTNARVLTATYGNVTLERIMDVVRAEPEREAFGRVVQSRVEREQLSSWSIPTSGGNLVRRAALANYSTIDHTAASQFESLVFTSDKPLSLERFQELVLSNTTFRGTIARVKGTVSFAEVPGHRLTLEISGKSRIDVIDHGKWVSTVHTALALVIAGEPEDAQALSKALELSATPSSTTDRAVEEEELVAQILANPNYKLLDGETSGPLILRLVGNRTFPFTEDELRARFGVDVDEANRTWVKCINSSGRHVLALPVNEEQGTYACAISRKLNPEDAVDILEKATRAAFNTDFAAVKHCACD